MKFVKSNVTSKLGFIGGAIILFSFVAQNYYFDKWNSRSIMLNNAMQNRAIIDKGALLNEILYFSVKDVDSSFSQSERHEIQKQKIQMAAAKIAYSQIMTLVSNSRLDPQNKVNLSNEISAKSSLVNNYQTFISFIDFVNKSYGEYSKEMNDELDSINKQRDHWRNIYLVLYICGSILLLINISSVTEKKNKNA